MKKKSFDIQKYLWWGGVPAILGAIVLCAKVITSYAEIPQKVQKIEDYIEQQQRSNEIQKEANSLMQQIITKQEAKDDKPEIILSPDGDWYFNEAKKEWRPVRELPKTKEK